MASDLRLGFGNGYFKNAIGEFGSDFVEIRARREANCPREAAVGALREAQLVLAELFGPAPGALQCQRMVLLRDIESNVLLLEAGELRVDDSVLVGLVDIQPCAEAALGSPRLALEALVGVVDEFDDLALKRVEWVLVEVLQRHVC